MWNLEMGLDKGGWGDEGGWRLLSPQVSVLLNFPLLPPGPEAHRCLSL